MLVVIFGSQRKVWKNGDCLQDFIARHGMLLYFLKFIISKPGILADYAPRHTDFAYVMEKPHVIDFFLLFR